MIARGFLRLLLLYCVFLRVAFIAQDILILIVVVLGLSAQACPAMVVTVLGVPELVVIVIAVPEFLVIVVLSIPALVVIQLGVPALPVSVLGVLFSPEERRMRQDRGFAPQCRTTPCLNSRTWTI